MTVKYDCLQYKKYFHSSNPPYKLLQISWDCPIIEHQAVAFKLTDMMINTQAARLLVWEAAFCADANPQLAATLKAPAAKTFAVDVAIKNARAIMEILGGYGVTSSSTAGQFLADACIGYSCDFTKDVLRLSMAAFL